MKFSIFTIISIIGVISDWAEAALADGKITLPEGLQLLSALGERLGLSLEFDVSKYTTAITPEDRFDLDEPELDATPELLQYDKPEE